MREDMNEMFPEKWEAGNVHENIRVQASKLSEIQKV